MSISATTARVTELLQPLLEAQGVELVELQSRRPRRGRGTLRRLSGPARRDRPGGLEPPQPGGQRATGRPRFDPGIFYLEVSSPGATRALKRRKFRRCAGRLVRITTALPWEGRQVHRGVLQGLEDETVCLQEEGKVTRIPLGRSPSPARSEIKNSGKEG